MRDIIDGVAHERANATRITISIVVVARRCCNSALDPGGATSVAETPVPRDTLVWATGAEPASLAPYLSVAPIAAQIGAKIFDGLLEYDAERRPMPALAESWEVSPDGRTISFRLRRDAVFHDGKPFTSGDVKFSFEEVLRHRHPRGANVFRVVTGVDRPDQHTAVLRLSEPAPYVLTALAAHEAPMLPRHATTLPTGVADGPVAAPLLIGTGPFKVASWEPGHSLKLTRNARYWRRGEPRLSAIELRFIADERERAELTVTGGAHVVSGLDTDAVRRVTATSGLRVKLDGADALSPMAVLSLNTTRPPFDKVEARQAIAYAIDRAATIGATWQRYARPAAGPIPLSLVDGRLRELQPTLSFASTDAVERANRLLDAAGMARREDGVRLAVVHDIAPLGPEWQRLGEAVEQQLARVGIKVSSRFETIEAWMRRLGASGDFAMASHPVYGFSDPAIGLHRTLHSAGMSPSGQFANSARWRNVDADRLMDQAMAELDGLVRGRLYRELQEIVLQASPYVWLAELTPPVLVHRDLKGVMVGPLGLYGNWSGAHFEAPTSSSNRGAQAR